jgi:hypothetical protein
MNKQYVCRIHTNRYSGTFVREIGAYITGQSGELGSHENAEIAEAELSEFVFDWFDENMLFVGPEGETEVAIIAPTDQCVQIEFYEPVPDDIREVIKERARSFTQIDDVFGIRKDLEITDIEFLTLETQVTEKPQ